ncbi:MAG: nucleotide sugar dehydrogenase, partial [bacterium]
MKNVCVLGLGYIGLPTAAILASRGYKVTGVDVSQEVVNSISRGEVHIVEPDLDMLVRSGINSENFRVSLEPNDSDVYIICVPTPFKDSEGTPVPDISYVECCAKQLAGYVEKGNMVILESTSPPGTTEKVAELLSVSGLEVGEDIFVAHAPERVLPGNILREVVENDRIVGGVNLKSARKVKEFYEGFVKGEVVATDSRTAELCKLVENSYRDVNIAFANEMANVSELFGINVWDLIKFANRHPRVNILNPGPGVGGHCIAVDPWFIIDVAKEDTPL